MRSNSKCFALTLKAAKRAKLMQQNRKKRARILKCMNRGYNWVSEPKPFTASVSKNRLVARTQRDGLQITARNTRLDYWVEQIHHILPTSRQHSDECETCDPADLAALPPPQHALIPGPPFLLGACTVVVAFLVALFIPEKPSCSSSPSQLSLGEKSHADSKESMSALAGVHINTPLPGSDEESPPAASDEDFEPLLQDSIVWAGGRVFLQPRFEWLIHWLIDFFSPPKKGGGSSLLLGILPPPLLCPDWPHFSSAELHLCWVSLWSCGQSGRFATAVV